MTKKHWLAAAASIMAVCALVAGEMWRAGLSYVLPYIVMIVLPWLMAYKNRRGILICVAVMALRGLLFSVRLVVMIGGFIINGVRGYPPYYWEDAPSLLQLVFCVLVLIRMKKPIKEWALYVCPALQLIPEVVRLFELVLSTRFGDLPIVMSIWWRNYLQYFLPPIVLMISAYLLVSEKPERIDVKEVVQSVSIKGDETGYTYLDEYKKNMRK